MSLSRTGLICALLIGACKSSPDTADTQESDSEDTAVETILCEDPVSGFNRFTEEAEARGVDLYLDNLPGFESSNMNGGVLAEDLDGDGDIDLAFSNLEGIPHLYENEGDGTFVYHAPEFIDMGRTYGGTPAQHGAADLNGDTLPDLVIVGLGMVLVSWNAGDMVFGTPEFLFEDAFYPKTLLGTMSLGDVDGDGDLDLVAPGLQLQETSNPDPQGEEGPLAAADLLFLNEEGEFRLLAELTPEGEPGISITTSFTDRDGDGDQDLLILSDLGLIRENVPPNAFYRNDGPGEDGPQMTNDAPEIGADLLMSAMGLTNGDYNGDDWLDYCISDVGPIVCMLSDGGGGYYDAGVAMGLNVTHVEDPSGWSGWSIEIEDLDNDGLPDAVAAGGQPIGTLTPELRHPNALWRGVAGELFYQFENQSDATDFGDETDHYGLATADLDGDGFLDIVLMGAPGQPKIYMNHCGEEAWLQVDLHGPPENSAGFGARVILEAGDKREVRELHNVRAMGQSPSVIHFGLGDAERVDTLTVIWPDGKVSERQDLLPRRMVEIAHPEAR